MDFLRTDQPYCRNTIVLLMLAFTVNMAYGSVQCENGGVPYNSTACNCTGTCLTGNTCNEHPTCGNAPIVDNTIASWNVSRAGCDVRVTYTCNIGFRVPVNSTILQTVQNISCSGSGWSDSPVDCVAVVCHHPGYWDHTEHDGAAHGELYSYGEQITFRCQDFHVRKHGHYQRTCQMNGTWSGTTLRCYVSLMPGSMIALVFAACCAALIIFLTIDFIRFHMNQQATREIKVLRANRVEMRAATNSPVANAPMTPRVRRASGYLPSMIMSPIDKLNLFDKLTTGSRLSPLSSGDESTTEVLPAVTLPAANLKKEGVPSSRSIVTLAPLTGPVPPPGDASQKYSVPVPFTMDTDDSDGEDDVVFTRIQSPSNVTMEKVSPTDE